jgi:hypothetical protein
VHLARLDRETLVVIGEIARGEITRVMIDEDTPERNARLAAARALLGSGGS